MTDDDHAAMVRESPGAGEPTAEDLAAVVRRLTTAGADALRAVGDDELVFAWEGTVDAFLDTDSAERRALDPGLTHAARLSPAGLQAGLEAVLGGQRGAPLRALAAAARERSVERGARPHRALVLVVLAGNLPGLAVQPLLPALLSRRPVLVKSSTAEPLFAAAFVRALTARLPALAAAVAALSWRGGTLALEAPLLAVADPVLVYGDAGTLRSLAARAGGRLVAYGPRLSLAVIGAAVDPELVAAGLARDVALFEQRGCLSVHAVYTAGDAMELAVALRRALADLAHRWSPGPVDPAAAAAVQQLRSLAALTETAAGTEETTTLAAGTVLVDRDPTLRPSPGLRTVRVHPLADLGRLPALLAPWSGQLQGVALAGDDAWSLVPELELLGVSRCAPPGELQTPDAAWHNGGVDPLTILL
jgi:hypothetical protein